ncbi:hypothetical protein [Mycolicibacterium phocaicum]|uniref:Uncharacterized protein n=1 Tax=Mycolicibacterium phocaicum TaxID=319706 RepID=A0A7I7ZUD6_9MYCO|nr:hypothetical protein [Mycolicibacterium phocaicum]TLH61050.1 hypothetical protein C1S79_26055 [Mycolicibacterium phocaicum]BBZ57017.1 hypothetical protein MPHO_40090 [Mycolicibacterium phocaicum]
MPKISRAAVGAAVGALIAAATAVAGPAEAVGGPGGFGNAQDTINALQAQGFTVLLNGAAVYPLSGCKVLGIEGLRNDNVDSAGAIIDRTKMTVAWVDISCKGG